MLVVAARTLRSGLLFAHLLALAVAAPAHAAALGWLTAQQNLDGSYGGTQTSLATPLQSTAEVLRAQQSLGDDGSASFASGLAFVGASVDPDTELLARKIVAHASSGYPTDAWVSDLLLRQGLDGGFGDRPGDAASVLATAFALEALGAAQAGPVASGGAIAFLLSRQLASGGWADGPNEGSIYLTAQCMRALAPYAAVYRDVAGALTGAQSFLVSRRGVDGLWGEDFVTALALLASAAVVPDASVLDVSAAALRGRQLLDESWADDTYTTALALQALAAYDARRSGTPAPSAGAISGHVVRAGSTEPVVGAMVTIVEPPGASVVTNGEGYYLIPGLPAGTYTVTATKAGFTSASVIAGVAPNQVTVGGDLVLDLLPNSGLVRGLVFDAGTGQPLAGVQVTFAAGATSSVLTNASGAFDSGPLAPATYAITFAKAGYTSVSGSAAVAAGQTVSAQLGMTPAGGYQDASPGTVAGRVVDGATGAPIAGAVFDLGGGLAATTGADGAFAVASVPRASYQGSVSAAGYSTATFTLLFPAGASGNLGTLPLFKASTAQPPTTLTLRGLVADGVTGAPIPGASVLLVQTGASTTAGADGRFVLSEVALKSFDVTVAAAGYVSTTYGVQVTAFGEAEVTLKLSPPGNGATSSTLSGLVSDASTGAAVAGAVVAIEGVGASATTGADGRYVLAGVATLEFTVSVTAVGYERASAAVRLTSHGSYTLDAPLKPVAGDSFQVVSITPRQPRSGANTTALFDARVASLLSDAKAALVLGEVQDASGTVIARLTPYAEGTTTPTALFSFDAGEVKDLVVPWSTAQFPPGTYRIVLRVVEPGTITRAVPLGQVLAEGATHGELMTTLGFAGALELDPPLTQAGLPTPVAFSALIQNAGNAPLAAGTYALEVVNPATGATLFTAAAEGPALEVSATARLTFGSWVPTDAGNLRVTVRRQAGDAAGELTAPLYVGDKASGTFTVDRTVVPEGTQVVHGTVAMQGVDVSRATSTDPLFKLVKTAVTKGGAYTGVQAIAWHQANRCLGCHIQTQSLLGMSAALSKATIDPVATQYLYNTIATSQWTNGALRIAYPQYSTTQTALGLWSLGSWADVAGAFRTKYRAAQYLQSVKVVSGDRTYWTPDHASGWWNTNESHTTLAIQGYAGLLRAAGDIDLAAVTDWALGAGIPLGGGAAQGMTMGPDGLVYVATSAGTIKRIDLSAGTVATAWSGLPGSIQGLAFEPDGTLDVTSTSTPSLIRLRPDGTRLNLAIGGSLTDAAYGPDGLLYLADQPGRRILRVTSAGTSETFVSGGLLNGPRALAFDSAGNLLVANGSAYNILKIAPDRTVSIYSDGLAYQPVRMALAPDGDLYVTTSQPYSAGGLVRIRPNGAGERVLEQDGVVGVVAAGSQLVVANNNTGKLHPITSRPLDTSGLSGLRAEIPRGARFLLSAYTDNNSDNVVHALRLIGLAEARPFVDASLGASIDTAIAYIANLLRARQRADGGWSRYTWYNASDPLATAMVGIALEYTNPSADDPQIRKTIQYLIQTQRADGSWDNYGNGLSTRLASTSFVMVFMPKALDRLGGIDIGLHLQLAPTVQLTNPGLPATSVVVNADGTTDYTWQLQGVTAAGRTVDFDLVLLDMGLHEARPVALAADLAFENSFVAEMIRLPLDVPVVRAQSAMELAVATDRAEYGGNEDVAISATVANTGPVIASGEVELEIRTALGAAHLYDLPPIPVADLAPGAQVVLPGSWNTGATLPGDYEVHGRLIDPRGRVLSESTAPFRVRAPAALAATGVTTDRQLYEAWDVVNVMGRVEDVAPNALLAPSRVELTIASPSGATLLYEVRDVPELVPLAIYDLPYRLDLVDAPEGVYTVTLVLQDAFTRVLLDTSAATFRVVRHATQAISGTVVAAPRQVYRGDPVTCTEATRNAGGTALAGVSLVHRLVAADTGSVVEEAREITTLQAGGVASTYLHQVDTRGLATGGYACVLAVLADGAERTLGFAGFDVVPPPVKIAADLRLGGRGRLLILLDETLAGTPQLAAERAYLEDLLRTDGWSYTITENGVDFAREFHTGSYRVYAVLAEASKVSEQTMLELREAIFRGDGLVFAGKNQSAAHEKWATALGVKMIGRVTGVQRVDPLTASPLPGAFAPLAAAEKPLRIQLLGAESLARYQITGATDRTDCIAGAPQDCSLHPERYLDAATLHGYGAGQAAFVGVDLLAIATRDGKGCAAGDDLLTLLHLVHRAATDPDAGAVVPVQLTVTNLGIAVSAAASVSIPNGVEVVNAGGGRVVGSTLVFEFPLAVDEVRTLRFHLRLPAVAGPIALHAVVTAAQLTQTLTVTAEWSATVVEPEPLDVLQGRLDALAAVDALDAKALSLASTMVGRAISVQYPDQAIDAVLQGTSALDGLDDPRITDIRIDIDLWLRWTARTAYP